LDLENTKVSIRNENTLKFFFGFNLTKEDNIKRLKNMQQKNNEVLKNIYRKKEEHEANMPPDPRLIYPKLLGELIVDIMKTQNKWADKAIEILKK
jgi:hypothetical protein